MSQESGISGIAQNLLNLLNLMIPQLQKYKNVEKLSLPPEPPEDWLMKPGTITKGGRSNNYEIMGRVLAYVYFTLAYGANDPRLIYWRNVLIDEFKRQENEWMVAEQCAPDPHAGMWAGAIFVCFMAANYFNDTQILEMVSSWISKYLFICKNLSTSNGEVYSPCCNSREDKPYQKIMSSIWRLYSGRKLVKVPPIDNIKDDRYWTGFVASYYCNVQLKAVQISSSIPKMRCPLFIQRTGNGYRAFLQSPQNGQVNDSWVCNEVVVENDNLVSVKKAWA